MLDLISRPRAHRAAWLIAVAACCFHLMCGVACAEGQPPQKMDTAPLLSAAQKGDEAALAKLQAAAEAGATEAQYALGAYYVGKGSYRAAAQWFGRGAAAGDARSLNDFGALMLGGYGVDRNPQMAQKYFERAGEAGFAAGFRMAGEIALGNNERDRGMALIQRAAEAGDVDAQFRMSAMLANAARSPAEMQAAVGWLNRAATAGHALAAEQLGVLYMVGGLGVPRDPLLAQSWLERAAAAGRVSSKTRLAQMLKASPDRQDRDHAVELLRQASAAGDVEASVMLYEQLAQAGQPDAAALNGLRAAAERGHPRACLLLGQSYAEGRGQPKDAALGQFWMARAAAIGEPVALQRALQPGAAM